MRYAISRPERRTERFTYNSYGRLRQQQDCNNIVTTYAYDARYLRGINLIACEQDEKLQYYLYNAHGDVVQRTDEHGTALQSYWYDAFGNEQTPEALDVNPFRYCGEYYDREAETLYLRARSYDKVFSPKKGTLSWAIFCRG